jgi:hypothetical protein
MKEAGSLLFVIALALTFVYRRIAAAITLLACLLCAPLYFYFTFPGLFRSLFSGLEWSLPQRTGFVWNNWTIIGIAVLLITARVSLRNLRLGGDAHPRRSE